MSAPKLLDRLRAKEAELLELERRSRLTAPPQVLEAPAYLDAGQCYRDHQAAKVQTLKPRALSQTKRIRVLSAPLEAGEVRAAFKRIEPKVCDNNLDRLELALSLALLNRGIDPQELLQAAAHRGTDSVSQNYETANGGTSNG